MILSKTISAVVMTAASIAVFIGFTYGVQAVSGIPLTPPVTPPTITPKPTSVPKPTSIPRPTSVPKPTKLPNQAPMIVIGNGKTSLPNGIVGKKYNVVIFIVDPDGDAITASISSVSKPIPGISSSCNISGSIGHCTIIGTPTKAGTSSVRIFASDGRKSVNKVLPLKIDKR